MNDRARVPFALVGVLLVLSSATLSATLATRPAPATDPAVERAVERTTAASVTVLRDAAREAARDAARNPLVVPANTTAGSALNGTDDPFVGALRVRIAVAARERLRRATTRVEDVTATATLPGVDGTRAALERVHVEPTGPNGTWLRVHVENVTVTAERGGTVETRRRNRTFVVRSPVLALHRRVERFERRLNNGPLEPGLGQRLTAQLYPVAWARGYAQHAGAPIANVLANRHVELATNRGVHDIQRTTFGRADPAAGRAIARAGRRVAARDLLAVATERASVGRMRAVLAAAADEFAPANGSRQVSRSAPGPETPMRIAVNHTADRALAATDRMLPSILRAAYTARARVVATTREVRVTRDGTSTLAGWERVDSRSRTTARVELAGGGPPTPGENWTQLDSATRRVVRTNRTVHVWRHGDRTRETVSRRTRTVLVSLAVVARPGPKTSAPPRGVASAFRRGGPFDGPNLADVAGTLRRRLVDERGGMDALARRAVAGTLDTSSTTATGDRPARLERWVRRDLAALHRRVRDVSVLRPRGEVGSYEVSPAAALAKRVQAGRGELLDAPQTYESVAAKARTAARAAYLDAVTDALEERATRRRERRGRLDETLRREGAGSLARLGDVLDARRPSVNARPTTPNWTVDGAPAYLPLAAVDRARFGTGSGTIHPLAARNLNVFTVPHGDAADAVVGSLFGSSEVDLRTAARTLRAAERVDDRNASARLTARRRRLRDRVERAVDVLRNRSRRVLRQEGVGTSRSARVALVERSLARWNGTSARALAFANGSAVPVLVDRTAAESPSIDGRVARDRLTVRLRTTLATARRSGATRPPESAVDRAADATRAATKAMLRDTISRGICRTADAGRRALLGKTLGAVPAGLPVAPVPGYWYATTNVWHVEVRGGYERFVVRTNRGDPSAPLAYVRERGRVHLDVDGDGTSELLGRSTRLTFGTSTTVVVVVPPTGTGVGDTDGQADERSAGWPGPDPPRRRVGPATPSARRLASPASPPRARRSSRRGAWSRRRGRSSPR